MNILEAQRELALDKKQAKVLKLLSALKNNLERYYKLEQKINSYNVSDMLSAVNALTKSNPTITLKFNAQVMKLQKVQLELKHEIYQTYIKLLSASDLLNQKPLVNYLSNELQPL